MRGSKDKIWGPPGGLEAFPEELLRGSNIPYLFIFFLTIGGFWPKSVIKCNKVDKSVIAHV